MRQQNYSSKLILVIFLIIIISQFSFAQTTITPTESSNPTPTETNNDVETNDDGPDLPTRSSSEKSEIPKTPEEILNKADRATREGLARESEISEVESIILPTPLQKPTKFIFGINDSKDVSLEKLIVLVGIFVILFVLIWSTIGMLPFFDKDWSKLLGALAITLLISLTGVVNNLLNSIYELTDFANWLSDLGPWKIAFAILFIAVLFYVLPITRKWLVKSGAKSKGQQLKQGVEDSEYITKAAEAVSESD